VEECKTAGFGNTPCPKIVENSFCKVYVDPAMKWLNKACPLRYVEMKEIETKKLNPLKASKKASKKR
jgi:hypothetical protein